MIKENNSNRFKMLDPDEAANKMSNEIHKIRDGILCDTESRGFLTPKGLSITELVLDSSEGFIPLWAKDVTLRWRFQSRSLNIFSDPEGAKDGIRNLLGEAVLAWGYAAPIKFTERDDAWDFEIVVRERERCNINGCVLASAFFPDSGQHELIIYPNMFTQSIKEQIETLTHEIGHIFGLRHFFAQISETQWASEIFGEHNEFSIMNYGEKSELTENDKKDLKRLYELVWSGDLPSINGTPVRVVKPFSTMRYSPENAFVNG